MTHPDLVSTFACLMVVGVVCGFLYWLGSTPPQPTYGVDDDGHYVVLHRGAKQPERWRDDEGNLWASVAEREDGSREYRMDRRGTRAYL